MRVAFLGPEGTYSHQATLRLVPEAAELLPCPGILDVFEALAEGTAAFGVVPVENRLEGSVGPTLEGLKTCPVPILAELFLPVVHALMVPPGRSRAAIRRIYSHPQALGQCRRWLREHLPEASPVERLSTAEAAAACVSDDASAAIASTLAAELQGLEILAAGIQDAADNATRFFLLGPGDTTPTGADSTSLLLHAQDRPGALLALLTPFAQRGLNLSRIESRPNRERAWEYDFFVDILGHAAEPTMVDALKEIANAGVSFQLLGTYPRG